MGDSVQVVDDAFSENVTYPGENEHLIIPDFIKTLSPRECKFIIRRLEINALLYKLRVINLKYKREVGSTFVYPFRFISKVAKDKYPYIQCGDCKQTKCGLRIIPIVKHAFQCVSLLDIHSPVTGARKHKVYSIPDCQPKTLCDDCLTSYRECECGKYFIFEDENKCPECLNWVTITVNIIETPDFSFNSSYLPDNYLRNYAGIEIISIHSSKLVFKYNLQDYPYDKERLQYRNCKYLYNIIFGVLGGKSIAVFMDGYSEHLYEATEVKSIFTANKEYTLFALPHTENNEYDDY